VVNNKRGEIQMAQATDFLVTQTSRHLNGEFKFVAVSNAAKRFIVDRTGEGAVSFSRDVQDFMPAVKDILSENLTIVVQ
jgi:hypothetical protein